MEPITFNNNLIKHPNADEDTEFCAGNDQL